LVILTVLKGWRGMEKDFFIFVFVFVSDLNDGSTSSET